MKRDVLLVTIDCWRLDAIERMANIREVFADGTTGEAVSHGMATYWAFPPVLASGHAPGVHARGGGIEAGVTTLPGALSDAGYQTAAVIGSNPNLLNWTEAFDHYENAGLTQSKGRRLARFRERATQATELATLRNHADVGTVTRSARRWYAEASGPRFLWAHLMDLHAPYYPGIRRGFDIGLLRTYEAILRHRREGSDVPERVRERLANLYWACVEWLDERIGALFEFVDDDALVVVTGDHGEALDREYLNHSRPYEEVLRVPILSRNIPVFEDYSGPVRQVDLPPTLLSELGVDVPGGWEGTPVVPGQDRVAHVLSRKPENRTVYVGARNATHRLFHTLDQDSGEIINREFSCVNSDIERNQGDSRAELEAELESFLKGDDITATMESYLNVESDIVQTRLKKLGYM